MFSLVLFFKLTIYMLDRGKALLTSEITVHWLPGGHQMAPAVMDLEISG